MASPYEKSDPHWRCKLKHGGEGHEWDHEAPLSPYAYGLWGRDILYCRCVRCGTERFQKIALNGVKERNTYNHPEGYRVLPEDAMPAEIGLKIRLQERRASAAETRDRIKTEKAAAKTTATKKATKKVTVKNTRRLQAVG